MTSTASNTDAGTRDEDSLLSDFLALGRAYLDARREQDLVDAFFGRVTAYAPSCALSLRIRDSADESIRVFGAPSDSKREPAGVSSEALDGIVDHGNFVPLPTFVSDFAELPMGRDLAVAEKGRLVCVLSVAHAEDFSPSPLVIPRILRFTEQLVDGVSNLLERRETARLRLYAGSIVERSNVPIAVVDGDGHVRLSNCALRNVLELDSSELATVGPLLSFVNVAGREKASRAHADAMRGVASSGVELLVDAQKSGEHRLLVDFEPIRVPSGEIDSVLIVARDVTRVRQLEDQVSHADRLATLGQLAAGVVHELNNPLTSILVYTEYVLRQAEARGADDGEVEKLERVLESAGRIQEFAKDLVTYARTERGVREPIDVTQILDQAVAFCAPVLERGQVRVTRDFEPGLPLLPVVRGQVQQIFVNLITNAAHALGGRPGRLHLRVGTNTRGFVEIRVEDDGPGVPEAKREEIFRPFVTTKSSGEGTGLGLSIVRTLAERHGGTVSVEDSPLGGAGFVLALPTRPISDHPPAMLRLGE